MILNKLNSLFWATLLIPFVSACVGPMTPFGSIDAFTFKNKSSDNKDSLENQENRYPRVVFWPKKQVLHDRSPLTVEIVDRVEKPRAEKLRLIYNNQDVTDKFLESSDIESSNSGKSLIITFKNLRIPVGRKNDIKVVYGKQGDVVVAQYLPPICSLFEKKKVLNTSGFKPPKRYLAMIDNTATNSKYNPSFLAGIVAQESGFDPKAISWAKALGLTQVTSIAEEEIIKQHQGWPRYPHISEMSYLKLKAKIYTGEINAQKEWRLNPEYSLKGGISYLNYLNEYWSMPENMKVVESLPGEKEINLSSVILASYNSGAARVKSIIRKNKARWLEHNSLQEAFKYIQKVSSYCYHFSQGASGDDS